MKISDMIIRELAEEAANRAGIPRLYRSVTASRGHVFVNYPKVIEGEIVTWDMSFKADEFCDPYDINMYTDTIKKLLTEDNQ